jgi:hypothetical protein
MSRGPARTRAPLQETRVHGCGHRKGKRHARLYCIIERLRPAIREREAVLPLFPPPRCLDVRCSGVFSGDALCHQSHRQTAPSLHQGLPRIYKATSERAAHGRSTSVTKRPQSVLALPRYAQSLPTAAKTLDSCGQSMPSIEQQEHADVTKVVHSSRRCCRSGMVTLLSRCKGAGHYQALQEHAGHSR